LVPGCQSDLRYKAGVDTKLVAAFSTLFEESPAVHSPHYLAGHSAFARQTPLRGKMPLAAYCSDE